MYALWPRARGPAARQALAVGAREAEAKTRDWAVKLVAEGRAVLVCPEVAGGLPIPRPAAEIVDGSGVDVLAGSARVISETGEDVTENYLAGARKAAEAARGV